MTSKVFVAKLQGECSKCNKPIAIGQRIAKDEKTGKFQHADCIWPSHANSKTTTGQKGGDSTNPNTLSNPELPLPLTDKEIEEITALSITHIKGREELKMVDTVELIPLIAEQMALRRLKKDQEFSMRMSQHIQAVKLDNIKRVKGE